VFGFGLLLGFFLCFVPLFLGFLFRLLGFGCGLLGRLDQRRWVRFGSWRRFLLGLGGLFLFVFVVL